MEKRIITTDVTEEDVSLEGNLRPQTIWMIILVRRRLRIL